MKFERQTKEAVVALRDALASDAPKASAARLRELEEAEGAGLITTGWRKSIDVDRAKALIGRGRREARKEWEIERDHLRSILAFGGRLAFEEAMLVLTIRSELQLVATQLQFSDIDTLDQLDEGLTEVLVASRDAVAQCRRKRSVGLAASLPHHWWWRTGRQEE